MANEIDVSMRLSLNENATSAALKALDEIIRGRLKVDQATSARVSQAQTIGTTFEALAMGDVATAGYAFFQNLDATNFVEIGVDSGGFVGVIKLKPGEAALLRLGTNAPQARADGANVVLYYDILAD